LVRLWKTAVLIVATAYFVVDGVSSYVTRRITVWSAKRNIFERAALRRFFATLSGARAFSGTSNHPGTGKASGGIFDGNRSFRRGCDYVHHPEVLKLTFVEQLFQLNRKKLLSIPAFASGYQYWRQMMDLVKSMEAWKVSRRLADKAAYLLRTRWLQFKRVHHLQFRLYHK